MPGASAERNFEKLRPSELRRASFLALARSWRSLRSAISFIPLELRRSCFATLLLARTLRYRSGMLGDAPLGYLAGPMILIKMRAEADPHFYCIFVR